MRATFYLITTFFFLNLSLFLQEWQTFLNKWAGSWRWHVFLSDHAFKLCYYCSSFVLQTKAGYLDFKEYICFLALRHNEIQLCNKHVQSFPAENSLFSFSCWIRYFHREAVQQPVITAAGCHQNLAPLQKGLALLLSAAGDATLNLYNISVRGLTDFLWSYKSIKGLWNGCCAVWEGGE